MVTVEPYATMVVYMRDNIFTIKNMVMELMSGQMVRNMKVAGMKTNNMVLLSLLTGKVNPN